MSTTKTISHIGNTKFELVKDTYDAFRFTVDDKSSDPNSPKTVMYISSEPTSSAAPTPLSTAGRVTMSNLRAEGATSTRSADVDGDIGVGGKILIREGTGVDTATRAAIYAEKDTSSDNHRLILDPYREDDSNPDTGNANSGTVYIRGNLIVEGDKTILDTAEHITSENLFGINAREGVDGNTTGGAATEAGIHVYSGTVNTQFLYNFVTERWRTAAVGASTLNDLEAKNLYITDLNATGTSTLTTVDINGGNIDGTAIGAESASTAKFTTIEASGATTLNSNATVGGTLGVTGATTLSSLTTSSNATVGGTLGVTGATTLSSDATIGGTLGVTGATTLSSLTTSSNATVGGTLGVTGATTLSSDATIGGTLGVTGATTLSSDATIGGTLGVTGAVNFSSTLGVTGALTAASGNFGTGTVTAATFIGDVTGNVSDISNHTTTDLGEGSNLYYTVERSRAAISVGENSILSYDPASGVISAPGIGGSFSASFAAESISNLADVNTSTDYTNSSEYDKSPLVWNEASSSWSPNRALELDTGVPSGFIYYSPDNAEILTNAHATVKINGGLYIAHDPLITASDHPDGPNPDGSAVQGSLVTEGAVLAFDGFFTAANITSTAGEVSAPVMSATKSKAVVFGNIVPVALSSAGGRDDVQTLSSSGTVEDVPLHADILNHYINKTFAAGKCVVALTDGTEASVAIFSFSKCGNIITMSLDQEVHSDNTVLYLDYDSSGIINLTFNGTGTATYCVKVLPIMTSDSVAGLF